jgi:hypothetical protein
MLTSLPRRLALILALAVPLAAPSIASATTLDVGFPSPDIVEGQPTPMRVASSADPFLLFTRIVAKPLTPEADCSRGPLFDHSPRLLDTNDDSVNVTTSVVFARAGTWLVCAWAGTAPAIYAEQALTVSVRPPHARVAVGAPRRARPGRSVRVSFAFDVESPRRLLYGLVRRGRCGLGADAARAQKAFVEQLRSPIAGSGAGSATIRFRRPGHWRVCAYVQRDAGPGAANAVAGADITVSRAAWRQAGGGEFGRGAAARA